MARNQHTRALREAGHVLQGLADRVEDGSLGAAGELQRLVVIAAWSGAAAALAAGAGAGAGDTGAQSAHLDGPLEPVG